MKEKNQIIALVALVVVGALVCGSGIAARIQLAAGRTHDRG